MDKPEVLLKAKSLHGPWISKCAIYNDFMKVSTDELLSYMLDKNSPKESKIVLSIAFDERSDRRSSLEKQLTVSKR